MMLRPSSALRLLHLLVLLSGHCASGSYPRAQNVTWMSTNFKTLLTWEPRPSADYSYTVELSAVGGNIQRISNCVQFLGTMCDVTPELKDLKVNYTADVLSEPPRGTLSGFESPHTSSPRFCPYNDTDISAPEFKLNVSEDRKTTTLYVSDPLTSLYEGEHQLTIRDVFGDQLQYKITYRRNKSTGKKVHISKSNIAELTDLDRGESYCFNVQAYIPGRRPDKQLGQLSRTQCSEAGDQSIFKVYSPRVIIVTIVLVLLAVGGIIAVTVFCCKRRKKGEASPRQLI
ncbi:coagulation factor IIIa [Mugil cephalus]|uniref:coagulation factor IIIa n=1 Tax=Mugil cephalus TaxID=48193 RepID=UPI001FB62EB5|nr:coagulation factor IIIa [Mugil cephalus]